MVVVEGVMRSRVGQAEFVMSKAQGNRSGNSERHVSSQHQREEQQVSLPLE